MCGIGYLWYIASKQQTLKIGRFKLEGNKKFGALCILTVILLLLLGFHQTIFITVAISGIIVFTHSVFHKVPDSMNELIDDDVILLGANLDNV